MLLSAICVQKPLLEFQKAKLAFEAVLQQDAEMTHSIVRPTAFFKSLAGQVESCRKGGPYVMFGGGRLASCKPISEADLARFMADCLTDQDKINRVLPIGGPGPAMSAREQGELLFRALNRKPRMLSVPIALMDGPIALLEGLSRLFPTLQDTAEFGKIGRYYASESMLVWDAEQGCYDADATPSTGEDTLEQFFERVVREGMAGQELGDAGVFEHTALVEKPPSEKAILNLEWIARWISRPSLGRAPGVLLHPTALPGSAVCGVSTQPPLAASTGGQRHRRLATAAPGTAGSHRFHTVRPPASRSSPVS